MTHKCVVMNPGEYNVDYIVALVSEKFRKSQSKPVIKVIDEDVKSLGAYYSDFLTGDNPRKIYYGQESVTPINFLQKDDGTPAEPVCYAIAVADNGVTQEFQVKESEGNW